MKICDGTGAGHNAGVRPDNHLMVHSVGVNESAYVSLNNQRSFNAVFPETAAGAGEYVAYLENTSTTRNLIVDLVRVGGVPNVYWKMFKVTYTTAPTGDTTVTAVNMNLGSGITPEATMLAGNVQNLTAAGLATSVRSLANSSQIIDFDDVLILAPNTQVAFESDAVGSAAACEVFMRFYFKDIEE